MNGEKMGMSKLDEFINTIFWGDVLKKLAPMLDEFTSCIMFSPPYWSLRDYKVDGQIGLETDFNEYLQKMWLIFDELKRVLRKDGTLWVNLGDTYGTHTSKRSGQFGKEIKEFDEVFTQSRKTGLEKSLMMLPERLALGLIDRGWILRNKCIWQKPNPMPCSAKDRFTTTWEYLYFFVKSKKYWFDLDAVRRPHKQVSLERIKRPIKADTMYADHPGYHKQDRSDHTWLDPAGKNPGDVITTKIPQEDAEKMGSPRARQWRSKRDEELVEFFEKKGSGGNPDAPFEGHPSGANPGDFWSIPTQPSSLPHYASYPEKLCETPLKAGCPRWICKECGKARVRVTKPSKEYKKLLGKGYHDHSDDPNMGMSQEKSITPRITVDYQTIGWTFCSCLCPACGEADCKCGKKWRPGIVGDPFCGIGTTCIEAKKQGFDYWGIDIKKEYCDLAIRRLKDVHHQEVMKL